MIRTLTNRIYNRLMVERDLAQWRRAVDNHHAGGRVGGKTILLADLMCTVAGAKVEAILARSLAHEGYAPVVLLSARFKLVERIHAAANPGTRFVYLDDYRHPSNRIEAEERAEALMAADPSLERMLALEVDGVRTGRNVLSLVLRRLRVGRIDGECAEHRALVRDVLIQSLETAVAARRVIAEIKPSLALFNERSYTPIGEVFDVCVTSGIDAVQWLGAPQADRLLFKRYCLANRALHPLALDAESWETVLSLPWDAEREKRLMGQLESHYVSGAWFNRQQLQDGKQHMSAEEVRTRLGVAPGRKVAAVFCHILYDATFFFGDSLYRDYEEWLVETVRSAIANPQLDWIIKVHPANVWRSRMDGNALEQLEKSVLTKTFGDLPPHVRLMPADTDVNTWSLFHAIDYGLTVRGTVGMELPCLGVPMVTAGTGRYSHRGFTIDPETPEEFAALLARLHEIPPLDQATVTLARRYAFGTFFLRPHAISSFLYDYHAGPAGSLLAHNVRIKERRLRDTAEDVASVTRWMAQDSTADFMTGLSGNPQPVEMTAHD